MVKRTVYTFDKQITSLKADEANNSIWVAFAKNANGDCILERQSGFEPIQTFFSLTRDVDKIVDMDINTSNIFLAYEDSTLLGEIISLTTPNSNFTKINRPIGLVENPVGIVISSTHIYFLMPGVASGLNSELLRYTISGTYVETIDLSTVFNASTITIDTNEDIWITTNTNPITLVRVYEQSGGFLFSVTP